MRTDGILQTVETFAARLKNELCSDI